MLELVCDFCCFFLLLISNSYYNNNDNNDNHNHDSVYSIKGSKAPLVYALGVNSVRARSQSGNEHFQLQRATPSEPSISLYPQS